MGRARNADTPSMSTRASEHISPELALVCPELREQALALPPQPTVEQIPPGVTQPGSSESPATPAAGALRASGAALLRAVRLATIAILASVLLTLLLTLVADAVR
jgi:hypothetical protein